MNPFCCEFPSPPHFHFEVVVACHSGSTILNTVVQILNSHNIFPKYSLVCSRVLGPTVLLFV